MTKPIVKIVSFQGTLVQKRLIFGKKQVPMAFRTDNDLRFVVAENQRHAAAMQIGEAYRVRGREHTIGRTTYISIHTVKPVSSRADKFRRGIRIFGTAAASVALVAVVLTTVLRTDHPSAVKPKSMLNQTTSSDTVPAQQKVHAVPASSAPVQPNVPVVRKTTAGTSTVLPAVTGSTNRSTGTTPSSTQAVANDTAATVTAPVDSAASSPAATATGTTGAAPSDRTVEPPVAAVQPPPAPVDPISLGDPTN